MFIHPRKPLSVICKDLPACRLLADDPRFDMARLISTEDPEYAVKFAYLEHIVRITTPPKEAQGALSMLPSEMMENMLALIEGRDTLFQETLVVLEQNITEEDLSSMQVPDVALHLEFVSEKRVTERDVYAPGLPRLPHTYIGILEEHCLVLYTTTMTFVDGYSPLTGRQNNPLIPSDMLESISRELYWDSPGDDMATQTLQREEDPPVLQPLKQSQKREASDPPKHSEPPKQVNMKSLVVEWRQYDHRAYRKRKIAATRCLYSLLTARGG